MYRFALELVFILLDFLFAGEADPFLVHIVHEADFFALGATRYG